MKKVILCSLVLFLFFCRTNALAVSFGFKDVEGSDQDDFSVEITETKAGKVLINVANSAPADDDSWISAIYIQYSSDLLFDIRASRRKSTNSGGPPVKFKEDTVPGNPLEAAGIDFNPNYYAKAHKNKKRFGAKTGDSTAFLLTFAAGSDFDDLLEALAEGQLRIAIDVSASPGKTYLADTTTTPVPEPTTMMLLGIGLIGIAGLGRKKLLKNK